MSTQNLLVELLVEELPPKALKVLGESFANTLSDSLKAQGLLASDSKLTHFATPRRLAAHITQVADKAADKAVQQKLMPVNVALDAQGQATPALLKKLGAMGFDATVVPQLKRQPDGKTDALFLDVTIAGVSLKDGLQKALDEALSKLPIPKVMSYQLADGWTSVNFVRPAHALLSLHGTEVIDVSVLGLTAGRSTQGHRFEAAKPSIEIKNADSYVSQLKDEGAVIASFAERRADIVRQLHAAAAAKQLTPIDDDALLDEVTALVERPNVLTCQFEKEFLGVPQECLILTMKANQKYFPLLDSQSNLTNQFLVVSNISPKDPIKVIDGNERVIRPRLADAKFFFDEDRKQTLESRLPRLEKIVYHNQLGSQRERAERVSNIVGQLVAQDLAGNDGASSPFESSPSVKRAQRAAELSKCDLVTDMVGEFPELQGIMGRYYALHDKEDNEVAEAILEQYLPRGAGDQLPTTKTGMALALADKLETLCGIFAVGQKPTGTKDPFGLRRAAIGVLRILIERQLPVDVSKFIRLTIRQLPKGIAPSDSEKEDTLVNEIYDYIAERLRGYYLEGSELQAMTETFDAVLAIRPPSLLDFDQHFWAIMPLTPDGQALVAINKRIHNILTKANVTFDRLNGWTLLDGKQIVLDQNYFDSTAERELFKQLQAAEADTATLFAAHDYQAVLTRLAQLRGAVDAFFDGVMVMADKDTVRKNRLALLARLRKVFLQVADLSRLPG